MWLHMQDVVCHCQMPCEWIFLVYVLTGYSYECAPNPKLQMPPRCHKNIVWLEGHDLISRGMTPLQGKLVVHVLKPSHLVSIPVCILWTANLSHSHLFCMHNILPNFSNSAHHIQPPELTWSPTPPCFVDQQTVHLLNSGVPSLSTPMTMTTPDFSSVCWTCTLEVPTWSTLRPTEKVSIMLVCRSRTLIATTELVHMKHFIILHRKFKS